MLKKEQLGSETAGCALQFLATPVIATIFFYWDPCVATDCRSSQFSAALETHSPPGTPKNRGVIQKPLEFPADACF